MKKERTEVVICEVCEKEFKRLIRSGRARRICFKRTCFVERNRRLSLERYHRDKKWRSDRGIPTQEDHARENKRLRETSEDMGRPITWSNFPVDRFVQRANLFIQNGYKPVILKPLKRAILQSGGSNCGQP